MSGQLCSGGHPAQRPQYPPPLGILQALVFGAPPLPLRHLRTLFPVMGTEGWAPSAREFRFPGSGGLCVPERRVPGRGGRYCGLWRQTDVA